MGDENQNYSFSLMLVYLKDKIKWALNTPNFVGYFIFVFILIGTLGIWYPVFKKGFTCLGFKNEFHPQNLFAFSMPVLSTLIIEAFLSTKSKKPGIKTLAFYGTILGIVSILLLCYGLVHSETSFYFVSFAGWIIVLSLWFLCNAGDERFEDAVDFDAPTASGQVADKTHLSGKGVNGGING